MGKPMRAHRKNAMVDNAKEDARFSREVLERDGRVCQMEFWSRMTEEWEAHLIKGNPDNPLWAAHIYKRNECGTLRYNAIVGIASCLDCHEIYDNNYIGRPKRIVRVPPDREERAFRAICLALRNCPPPVRRLPPEVPVEGA